MTVLLLLAGALAVLGAGWLMWHRATAYPHARVERLLMEGDWEEAGNISLRFERLEEAAGYFEHAGKHSRAAHIHARLGHSSKAAALYEAAGDFARAAHLYGLAGDVARAEELRRAHPAPQRSDLPPSDAGPSRPSSPPSALPPSPLPSPPPPRDLEFWGIAPAQTPLPPAAPPAVPDRRLDLSSPLPTPVPPPPASAAGPAASTPLPRETRPPPNQVELDFRAAVARAGSSEAEQARLRGMAQDAAEVLLAAGEIRRAADVYRDGGLDEEAIHLYVNVLGAPGDAAPLLAAAGHHERAAELYEVAGQRAAAAAEWVVVARHTEDPRRYVDRIGALSGEVLIKFLEDVVSSTPASAAGGELRDRLENERARTSKPAPAAAVAADEVELDVGPELDLDLETSDLDSLARELAVSAAERAMSDLMSQFAAAELSQPTTPVAAEAALPAAPDGVGLEQAAVATDRLGDGPVRTARAGPSIEALERFIGGRQCDLPNIEVFYRLGLACLAAGQWDEAMSRFEAVEEASPGYRDAWPRVEQLRGWRRAMGARMKLGPATNDAGEGRYRLRGEVGRSPLAVVYRATDRLLRREVALKFFADDLGAQSDVKEQLQREGRMLSQISHPNLVTVYDCGSLEGRLYVAMEFVDGPSLERISAAGGHLSVVESLRIARQVVDGLAYAHGRKIVHRALTPSNILRSTSGLVKVVDFALTRALAANPRAARLLGASPYLSPEQQLGMEPDPRSDVFSAGVVLYEMLTGRIPPRDRPAPRPRSVVPSIPEVLDGVVMRALDPDPAERFPTAADLGKPIRRILEQVDRRVTAMAKTGGVAGGPDRSVASLREMGPAARARRHAKK